MKVLISGGSGLVGKAVSECLLAKGHEVSILSRKAGKLESGIEAFAWDPEKGTIDINALNGVDAIINLAGSTIAQRWTPHGKDIILRSRINATRLLAETLAKTDHQVKTFLSASAVGYYPDSLDKEYHEEDAPGSNFLSIVCQKWEQEAMHIEELGLRVIRARIGIVLDKNEGALAKMALPVKFGLGAALGSGKQWMPWIHKKDLAEMFVYTLENQALKTGVINAVGAHNVSNRELTESLAKTLNRPLFLPNVPSFVLKLMLGEMAATALTSNKVSCTKIQSYGFKYQYNRLEEALSQLYVD